MPARADGDFVQSLERGLAVIKAFGPQARSLTLADVARRSGLTRASARRFLITLERLGYVCVDGQKFSLRPRVLELGYSYLSTLGIDEVAVPHMEKLVAELCESSSLAVLDGDDITYVARVPTTRIMTVVIALGSRFPAYVTSMGRVLLSDLDPGQLDAYLGRVAPVAFTDLTVTDSDALRKLVGEAAICGYAIVDQELEAGLRSAAVPVRDHSGRAVAALNMSAHASRTSVSELRERFVPRLLEAASNIESDLREQAPILSTRLKLNS
jgi:IclR family pca regulon transcriptional regulator